MGTLFENRAFQVIPVWFVKDRSGFSAAKLNKATLFKHLKGPLGRTVGYLILAGDFLGRGKAGFIIIKAQLYFSCQAPINGPFPAVGIGHGTSSFH